MLVPLEDKKETKEILIVSTKHLNHQKINWCDQKTVLKNSTKIR